MSTKFDKVIAIRVTNSCEEIMEEDHLLARFEELDINGDGFLTMEEMKAVFEAEGEKWDTEDEEIFQQVDENGDGKITIKGMYITKKVLSFTLFFQNG